MTLEALEILSTNSKIQYLRTLLCGETMHEFDNLCYKVGSTTTTYLNQLILGLGLYSPPVNALSKKTCNAPQNEEAAQVKNRTLLC